MKNSYIYRCPKECKIRKHCFILKTEKPIAYPLPVLQKCLAEKRDIRIVIGGERPP